MRISRRGQVTIPHAVRERTGLLPNTEVVCVVDGGDVRILKAAPAGPPSRGSRAVELLRQSGGRIAMTTDEIMALTRGD